MGIAHADTHKDTLRFSFVKMLRLHATRPACWYSIVPLPNAGCHNLSSYLRLDPETYKKVLINLGLAYKYGETGVRYKIEKWKSFLLTKENSLPEYYQAIEYCLYGKTRCQMIRLGGMYDKKWYNPGPESEHVQVSTYGNLERKYGDTDVGGGFGEREKVLFALKKLTEIDSDEGNEEETDGTNESANVDHDGDPSAGYDDGEQTINIEIQSKYPTLNKLNVGSIKPSTLYALLREIKQVSVENGDGVFKFEYKIDCRKRRDLIIVPQVRNDESFSKYAKPVLENLGKALVSDSFCRDQMRNKHSINKNNIREEEEKAMIRRIIDHYCGLHQDLFVEVANDYGLDFKNKKMSEHFAAAMFAECGIGPTKGRIINRYLTAFFGRRVMPQENKIFRDDIAIDELPPETEVKVLSDNKKVHYFVKPLKEIMMYGIDKKLKEKKTGRS